MWQKKTPIHFGGGSYQLHMAVEGQRVHLATVTDSADATRKKEKIHCTTLCFTGNS